MKKLFRKSIAVTILASQLSHAELVIEEVMVTAQKRTESTQDIGAAISAVSGEDLQNANIFDFNEVARLTSGLRLDDSNPRNQKITLRGINVDDKATAKAAVDTYWNGIAVRNNVAFSKMFDLERIEILRGPQGTLQGRTSPGGAIQIHTKGPNMDEVDGTILTSITEHGETNTQFGASIPLIPGELAMRVSGLYSDNNLRQGSNVVNGKDDRSYDDAMRVTLAWTPNDDFSATLAYQYSEQSTRAGEISVLLADESKKYDRKSFTDGAAEYNSRNQLATLTLEYALDDHLITSITGYQKDSFNDIRDQDFINPESGIIKNQFVGTDTDFFSQELRLSSIETGFWEYIVGGYYENQQASTDHLMDRNGDGHYEFQMLGMPIEHEEFGLFIHNTLNFTDATRLQAGARWSKSRRLAVFDDIPSNLHRNSDTAVTGTIKLLHDIDDDIMVYASVDRSYRPGGVGVDPRVQNIDDTMYDEETSYSFEIGMKSQWFDNRLQVNASAFYQQYDDYISRSGRVMVIDSNPENPSGITQASGITFNGDADISGVDLDFTFLASSNWRIGGAMSYVDAKWDNADVPCDAVKDPSWQPGQGQVATCSSNGRIGDQPNWTANLNTEYEIPLDQVDLFTRGIISHTGKRSNDVLEGSDLPSYTTTDLYMGMRSKDSNWEVSVWAKNLFDKEAEANYMAVVPGASYRQLDLIPERLVGITGRYNF